MLLLGIVLAVFQQWCGINVIFNYAEEVFSAAGYKVSDILFNIVITGTVNLVFTLVAFTLVDRFGRRILMLFGAGGLTCIYTLLGLCYAAHSQGVHVLALVVTAIGCYAMSLAPVTWVVISEIFPNRIRGIAMSIAVAFLWIACFILTYTFPILNRKIGACGYVLDLCGHLRCGIYLPLFAASGNARKDSGKHRTGFWPALTTSSSMRKTRVIIGFLSSAICLGQASVQADPLTIDLTSAIPNAGPVDLGQGTNKNPDGQILSADNRSLLLDGHRIFPVVGEFHYARYPAEEWRDELLKMKAGGITVVSTYVFWIHHEEEQGQFDWSGRKSLADFLKLCHEVGLLAIVRMGPWDHGEVRNGGFPDWVQKSGTKLRSTNPAFLHLVEPFYQQLALQMKGQLWKDGGPVIGVQVDNECNNVPYLLALKKMAQGDGVDVPLYTMTGWNSVAIPDKDLLPLFGAYSIGFWGGTLEKYRKVFLFSDTRDDGDLGAQMQVTHVDRSRTIALFPYACCEIGGGMMSSYARRIKIIPDDIAAMAMVKIGSGSNMQGYYMFQGGNNPDAKLSSLNEQHPNGMPFKDYDFQAPLGACGQVREQFHLLREQHLFLHDFGATLADTVPVYPDVRPRDLDDFDTLRWCVRWNGNAGFLFFNNRQPTVPMKDQSTVQFAMKTASGTSVVPSQPIAIANGSYGVWPINLDCNGVNLDYSTAQPLCKMQDGNAAWYFFTALDGIDPEISLAADASTVTVDHGQKENQSGHTLISKIEPGLNRAISVAKSDGSTVNIVVLSSQQAKTFYRLPFAGRERAVLFDDAIMPDGTNLRLQLMGKKNPTIAMFPAVTRSNMDGTTVASVADGIFSRLTPAEVSRPEPPKITVVQESPAGPLATRLKGMDDATWNDAAVYNLNIPRLGFGTPNYFEHSLHRRCRPYLYRRQTLRRQFL